MPMQRTEKAETGKADKRGKHQETKQTREKKPLNYV